MYQIIFYQDINGKNEVEQHLYNLKNQVSNKSARVELKKISNYLILLSEYGFSLGEPYIKHLDKDIWELRPFRNRILFAYYNNNTFIILSRFIKQSQKTPKKEIERAKKYFEDFKLRSENNE